MFDNLKLVQKKHFSTFKIYDLQSLLMLFRYEYVWVNLKSL